MNDDEPAGGDPACWLNRVCVECGAFLDDDSETCWRCGADRAES